MAINWNDVEELDGLDLINKTELIDVPFLITGVHFETNNSGVQAAYIDGVREDGTTFQFYDSSTGIKAQIVSYLTEKELGHVLDSGETAEVQLGVRGGLRYSDYETAPDARGKTRQARTYYLKASGKKAASAPAGAATARKRTAK